MQIARGARTCRRIPVEDFEGQIRPDLALALLRRFQRISDRVGECLPKLAKLITSNSYKFNLAISLLTPPNITNAENGYVPEDYRKLICENSIFNANFADDLIDLFFNPIIPLTHV